MRSRFGEKTSLQFNGLLADRSFATTDRLTRGYGQVRGELDYRATYDIVKDMPLSYYQHNRRSTGGREDRYELSLGMYFQGFPFLDVAVSRNAADIDAEKEVRYDTVNALGDTVTADSIEIDSLDRVKDKLSLRLFETSSPYVEKLLHLSRLGYEVSYIEFSAEDRLIDKNYRGRIVQGNLNVSPIQPVTVSAIGTYRVNPGMEPSREITPEFYLQAIDMPPGVEFNGRYRIDLNRFVVADSAAVEVYRTLNLKLVPGRWWDALGWFSPHGGLVQRVNSDFRTREPALSGVVLGNRAVLRETLTRILSVSIFPNERIYYRNENRWTTAALRGADDTLSFQTNNDLKLSIGTQGLWQTRWVFDATVGHAARHHQGESRYTKTWTAWLKSSQGVIGDYSANDSLRVAKIGPKLEASLSARDLLVIKRLLNNHTLGLNWYRTNGALEWRPEVLYTFYLQAIIVPEISVINTNSLAFREGAFDSFNGKLSALVNF
jgi:hypothetical protein